MLALCSGEVGDKNEHLVAAFCEKTSEVPTTITGLVAMKRCIDEDAMYMDSVQVIYLKG